MQGKSSWLEKMNVKIGNKIITAAAVIFMVTACAQKPVELPPPEKPVVKEVKKPAKKVRKRPPVVILISEDIPAYQQVASKVKQRLPKRSTTVLLGAGNNAALINQLKSPAYQQFVAVGLRAAKLAKKIAGREDETVFCQVFNYHEYNIVGPLFKGVAALPGTAELFSRWRKLSPGLQSAAVFTGPGLEKIVKAASKEAKKQGIQLTHKVVGSDKELLFEYKQLAPGLQGIWLLPDNRVLSGHTIKELMSFSVRNTKQVVVFNENLLRLGGLLSISSNNTEIAQKVVKRLDEAFKVRGFPGPELELLEGGDIQVNAVVARRYNLSK